MSELIKQLQFLGSEKVIVGSNKSDMVLLSLGKIYIKFGNSSRLLNDVFKAIDSANGEFIIVLDSNLTILSITYPGDNKLVYDGKNKILYITISLLYIPLVSSSQLDSYILKTGDKMSGVLLIELEDLSLSPLVINSKVLVRNLNSEFLSGTKIDDIAVKTKDLHITNTWNFDLLNIDRGTISSTLESPEYVEGLYGNGWRIDSTTNTLTIDNIIVRKTLLLLNDSEEIYLSRLKGINGNLWLSNSITITSIERITPLEDSLVEVSTSQGTRNHFWSSENNEALMSGWDYQGIEILDLVKVDLGSIINGVNSFYDYFLDDYYRLFIDTFLVRPKINDIYRCLSTNNNKIHYYDLVVTNISDDNIIIVRCSSAINDLYISSKGKTKNLLSKDLVEKNSEESEDIQRVGSPLKGDLLVLIGNINIGYSGIYLSSLDDDSPTINLILESKTPDYLITSILNTRLGNLSNILDTELNPNGFGLYTINPFIKNGSWIISESQIKNINGLVLDKDGKLEANYPFLGSNAEIYIKSLMLSTVNTMSQLILELLSKVAELEVRVSTLENK